MHRISLLAAAMAAAVATAPISAQSGEARRPNVVLIITDDVGYGDFGSHGAPDVRMPHIDSLAKVREWGYVGIPVRLIGALGVEARDG